MGGCCAPASLHDDRPIPLQCHSGWFDEFGEFERLNGEFTDMQQHQPNSLPNDGWRLLRPMETGDPKPGGFRMGIWAKPGHVPDNPNWMMRADGEFRAKNLKTDHFLDFLLRPESFPGLQEWRDLYEQEDQDSTSYRKYLKYCKVKAPGMYARDHIWLYTIRRGIVEGEPDSIFVSIRSVLDAQELQRVFWAANKRFKILKFKFKFPRARTFELFRARSRLHRSQIVQVNTRWKALAEIYTMHSFAPFSNLNFFVKNR